MTLLGGTKTNLTGIQYLKPNRRNRPGRPRKGRGKGGTGLYPVLVALGICFGVTPALAGDVCRQVADSDSVRTARTALAQRGIDLSQRATLRLANAFGHRAVEQRLQWLEKARAHGKTRSILKGKRVVVTTDGGRIRERQERRGRRRDSGYHSFDAPWREPKLLVIYVIDSHGNVDKTFRPIYDGTLDDCDAIFDMIARYLSALGAHEAKELILVGDGAKWIWDRVDELVKNVGIDAKKVKQVIAPQILGCFGNGSSNYLTFRPILRGVSD